LTEAAVVTFAGVVHPWMCDAMGHLNVRHYVGMFDDASFQLLGRVGGLAMDTKRYGWADVRMEIDYLRETSVGTTVSVHSHVEAVGTSSLTYVHALSGTLDGLVRARTRVVSVHFDLVERRKVKLPTEMQERADRLRVAG
jgi:acyl-CoA thioester hydrolase